MANKISVLIDVATDKAVSGLKGFKQSITDADGAVGKFKAAGSAAFDQLKANAVQFGVVAAAAVVTFGVKAIAAFQNTALEAGAFADASGLATEAASRWIAVGDDIGISSDSMQLAFKKLNVEIGKSNPLLEEYGITVRKGANGQVDMNATMLNAIDVIRGIQDPTKKAELAQAALGRGWLDMAELIEIGSDELTTSLANVSDAQVIDPEEVAKAREMRAAMDEFQDAIRDVALVLGEDLVPAATQTLEGLTKLLGPIVQLNQLSKSVTQSIIDWTAAATGHKKEAIDPLIFGYGQMADQIDTTEVSVDHITSGLMTSLGAFEDTTEATDDLTRSNELLARQIEITTDRYRDLKGELSDEEAFLNAEGMWAELQQSAVDAYTAASEGSEGAADAAFSHRQKVLDAKQAVVELGEKYADLPEEEVTRIVALIDEGSLEEAERRFNILARNREMQVSITAHGGVNLTSSGGISRGASGGIVTRPTLAIIGEDGPEAVVPLNQTPGSSPLNGHSGGVAVYLTVQTLDGSIAPAALNRIMEAINGGIRTGKVKLANGS